MYIQHRWLQAGKKVCHHYEHQRDITFLLVEKMRWNFEISCMHSESFVICNSTDLTDWNRMVLLLLTKRWGDIFSCDDDHYYHDDDGLCCCSWWRKMCMCLVSADLSRPSFLLKLINKRKISHVCCLIICIIICVCWLVDTEESVTSSKYNIKKWDKSLVGVVADDETISKSMTD